MTFLSYAQNFEDVMLWRALKQVEQGFYIDVGAFSPEIDSVTRAFYDRGWSGINLEPHPRMFAELTEQRPRDINLQVAVSQGNEALEIYLVDDLPGLSTLTPEYAEECRRAGHPVEKVTVPSLPLTEIWQRYAAGREVHFLKIDVEGAEKSVILSNDWSRNRPWILVIEATIPNSGQPSHAEWEPLLLQAGYEFVYFDGLNRFYLAQEHLDLRSAFVLPPNYFDDFKLLAQQKRDEEIDTLRGFLANLENDIHGLVASNQNLLQRNQNLNYQNHQFRQLLAGLRASRFYRLLRKLGRWSWLESQIQSLLALPAEAPSGPAPDSGASPSRVDVSLADFSASIDALIEAQPNAPLLRSIRQYNFDMIDEFNKMFPLKGKTLLDVGASHVGYALERSLQRGVTFYAGVTLGLPKTIHVYNGEAQRGMIIEMDAAELRFPDEFFDAVFSLSAFEHIAQTERALAEIRRVLKPGGRALLSFEPIWTSPRGHHLHHFGECAKVMPDWAHLVWSPEEMRRQLTGLWPASASISLEKAIFWTYEDNDINRKSLADFRHALENCGMDIEMNVPIPAENIDMRFASEASRKTGLSVEELSIRGLSVLLCKR